jgi:hypothetical protein
MLHMRISITLDDDLAKRMRQRARAKGQSLSAFIAKAGRKALAESAAEEGEPFELVAHGKTGGFPSIDLDRTSDLFAAEDRDVYGE